MKKMNSMNRNHLILTVLFAAAYVTQDVVPAHGADDQIEVQSKANNTRTGHETKDHSTSAQPAAAIQNNQ